jgi:phosphorylcholine metabolism protein LicD
MVEGGKIKLIFIMDSYDELSNKYLKQNLYITNKIEKWGSKDVKNYPKVITTTRNEIFSSDTEYMSWFWSEESKFKEVKLENFNDRDRLNFLK